MQVYIWSRHARSRKRHFSRQRSKLYALLNVWSRHSIAKTPVLQEFKRFCQSSEHRFPPCLHPEMIWSQHSNVQVSIFVTCLNFAVTGSGLWQLYVALVMTWYLAFKTAARTAKLCGQLYRRKSMSDVIKIFWCCTYYRQHTSFYRTSYVPDMNYILYSPTFCRLPLLTDPMDSLTLTLLLGWWGYILIYLCTRQRASWTYPPQVFTSVHLFIKMVRSGFTINSPHFQNN